MPFTFNRTILAAGVLAAAAATGVVVVYKSEPVEIRPRNSPKLEKQKLALPGRNTNQIRKHQTLADRSEMDPQLQSRLDTLERLAGRDPQKAISSLPEIEDRGERLQALSAIAMGWGKVNPEAAASWVTSLPSEEEQTEAVLGLAPAWTAKSAEDCLSWAMQQPAGNLREITLVEISDAWAAIHPREALTKFLLLESEDGTERGLHSIISQWTLDQPLAAIGFLEKLEDNPRRDELMQASLVGLASHDPDLAWKYSERFPDAESTAHVREIALESMAESRPAEAIKLANSVGGGEELLSGIARGWASSDEEAARKWINELPDEEMGARLQKIIGD